MEVVAVSVKVFDGGLRGFLDGPEVCASLNGVSKTIASPLNILTVGRELENAEVVVAAEGEGTAVADVGFIIVTVLVMVRVRF